MSFLFDNLLFWQFLILNCTSISLNPLFRILAFGLRCCPGLGVRPGLPICLDRPSPHLSTSILSFPRSRCVIFSFCIPSTSLDPFLSDRGPYLQ